MTCVVIKFRKKSVPGVLKRKPKNGGGGRRNFFPHKLFFQKCSWGSDTLLPMTMTRDRPKFWNLAWRSKVIIRKPWRRKNKKKYIYSDKSIRLPNEMMVFYVTFVHIV